MQIRITAPSYIQAKILLPSSKSICNRALIIQALTNEPAPLHNLSDCDDTRVMVEALHTRPEEVDILAAGTAMRFLTAFFAVQANEEHVMTGTTRMQQRPIRILVDALRNLGADITYEQTEGYPPLRIHGQQLMGSEISLPGNISSQYISALLLIGPMLPNGLTLHLTGNIISRPYIDLTLGLMNRFGSQAQWQSDGHSIHVPPTPYRSHEFTIESDWSAASYWYEIVALSKDAHIELQGLSAESLQGDSALVQLFEGLGVSTQFNEQGAILKRIPRIQERMDYDFTNQPDLAQTFVVTCALLGVPFRFSGLQSLKIKETDRMAALICELKKWGYVLHEEDDSILTWDGTQLPTEDNLAINTYEDHRMAMAFAPASLCRSNVLINDPQVVSKSYPHFWEDIRRAGFQIEEL